MVEGLFPTTHATAKEDIGVPTPVLGEEVE